MLVRRLLHKAASSGLAPSSARGFQSSASCSAITRFSMPAMSPTMTEGGLATWKVKEGQPFSAGDVLLEIETDKATMDVEAQDDGIMAKIVVDEGAKGVPVGKTIAMLAEEGDDVSNLEVPADETEPIQASTSTLSTEEPAPKSQAQQPTSPNTTPPTSSQPHPEAHVVPTLSKPLLPSVARLMIENHVSQSDAEKIKGTGLRGMLTKGDILAFLGKASSPTGTFKENHQSIADLGGAAGYGKQAQQTGEKKTGEPLAADAVRSMILSGLAASSQSARAKQIASTSARASLGSEASRHKSAFDELLDDYRFTSKKQPDSKELSKRKNESFAGLS